MNQKQHFWTMALALMFVVGLCSGTNCVAQGNADIQARIKKDGVLKINGNYRGVVEAKYGAKLVVRHPSSFVALGHRGPKTSPGNAVIQVGDQPSGFGKEFIWDRVDDDVNFVLFINAADDLGVSIDNLQPNDIVTISSPSGVAAFNDNDGAKLASSFVGLLGDAADIGALLEGYPQLVPTIDKATATATSQFNQANAHTDKRDAFGQDPGTGDMARQEGGLIFCLPGSDGAYYSGGNFARDRWIQGDGTRNYNNYPKQVPTQAAVFPIRSNSEHNTFRVSDPGPLIVLAWDFDFDDNAGFYKVFVHIKKGPSVPVVQIKKKKN